MSKENNYISSIVFTGRIPGSSMCNQVLYLMHVYMPGLISRMPRLSRNTSDQLWLFRVDRVDWNKHTLTSNVL